MIEGSKVMMGGKEWTIPALSFRQVRELTPKLDALSTGVGGNEVMVEVIHAAVSRNYPDVTVEQVEEVLDLRNVRQIFQAVMGQSGFEESTPGE